MCRCAACLDHTPHAEASEAEDFLDPAEDWLHDRLPTAIARTSLLTLESISHPLGREVRRIRRFAGARFMSQRNVGGDGAGFQGLKRRLAAIPRIGQHVMRILADRRV